MPSLLGNRKLNTYMDTLATRYCRVAWLPSNRGRVFSLGQPDVVRGRQYTTMSQSLEAEEVSLHQSTPVREGVVISECPESGEYSAQSEL
jgi:hypothetical protein